MERFTEYKNGIFQLINKSNEREAMQRFAELEERDIAKRPVQTDNGMACPICGNKALPWSRFCDECGQRWWSEEEIK